MESFNAELLKNKAPSSIYLYDIMTDTQQPVSSFEAKNHYILVIPVGPIIISSILSVAPQWLQDSRVIVSKNKKSIQIHSLNENNDFV